MKMRRFVIVLGLALLFSALMFFLSSFLSYEQIPIQLTVSDDVGFNVGTDALYFGSVPPGSSAHRVIHVRNDRFLFGRVNIKVFGEVAAWTSVTDNNFYLANNEIEDVRISVRIPADASHRDYNGTLRVYLFPL